MANTPPAPHAAPTPPSGPGHAKHAPQHGKAASFLGYLVRGRRRPGEVTVVSHSDLFYWWPVWLVGFIMTGLTWFQGVHAGFVKGDAKVIEIENLESYKFVDEVTAEEAKKYPHKAFKAIITNDESKDSFPMTTLGEVGESRHTWPIMHNSKTPGVIFCIILLVVIFITNVHLRGLWSVIAILLIVLGSVILALAGLWDKLLSQGRLLAIHINMGAYLCISLTLFVIWFINFAFFDRQRYVAVTPGQVRLHLAIGEGEIVYDTTGLVFQKQRSDLFRHWILGFGSGDLVIRPAGGKDPIDLPNVLFVGSKVQEIQGLIKEKEVVAS